MSKDGKLLYDNDPIWSQMYINDLSQDLDWSKINKFRNVCATGGILSFHISVVETYWLFYL